MSDKYVPLVLGTSCEPVRVMASLSASAVALKADSALWWSFSPCRTSTCSVMPASVAKLWKMCGIISQLKSPIFSRRSCRCVWQYGRDDRSTTARDKDSSRGAKPVPKRLTPRISPSAFLNAWPSAIAQSSAVWWSSMYRSPRHCSSRDRPPCLASACSMWSRKPRPVDTWIFCGASTGCVSSAIDTSICVSFVRRSSDATRWDMVAVAVVARPSGITCLSTTSLHGRTTCRD